MKKGNLTKFDPTLEVAPGPELRQALRPLWGWWWALLIVPLLCGGIAYYLMTGEPRYYQAQTTLQFGEPLGQTENQLPLPPLPLLGPTYKEMVMSVPFLQLVAAQLNNGLTAAQLQEDVIAYHVYWSSTIEIQATHTDPAQTLDILNTINALLIQQTPQLTQLRRDFIAQRQAELQQQNDTYQQQIDDLNNQLDQASSTQPDSIIANITTTLNNFKNEISDNNTEAASLANYLSQVETSELHVDIAPNLLSSALGPKPLDAALAIGTISLALVILFVYLLEKLNNKMDSVEELEHLTGQSTALVLDQSIDKGAGLAHSWDLLASEISSTYYREQNSARLLLVYEQTPHARRTPVEVERLADALSRLGIKTTVTDVHNFSKTHSLFKENQLDFSEDRDSGRILECELVIQSWPTNPQTLRYLSDRSDGIIALYDLRNSKKSNLIHLAEFLKINRVNVKTVAQV